MEQVIKQEDVVVASEKALSLMDVVRGLSSKVKMQIRGEALLKRFPGLEHKIRRNQLLRQAAEAKERGDSAEISALMPEIWSLVAVVMDSGLSSSHYGLAYKAPAKKISCKSESKKVEVKAKGSKVADGQSDTKKESGVKANSSKPKVKRSLDLNNSKSGKTSKLVNGSKIDLSGLTPLGHGDFDGVMVSYIMGYTGDTFCHRPVVIVRRVAGLYGCECVKHDRYQEYTLHRGILNQADLTSNGVPSPYWSVLDAMTELHDGFSMDDVLNLAVKLVGEEKREACKTAWYVLKTHATHPTKMNAGYCYMLDSTKDDKYRFNIRLRREEETLEYFSSQKKVRKSVKNKISKANKKVENDETIFSGTNIKAEEGPIVTVQVANVN